MDPTTLGESLHWSYANLAKAHAAVQDGARRYKPVHYMIRARLYKGLREGKMRVGELMDEERARLQAPPGCVYCGEAGPITLDHLLPRARGGWDSPDNLVYACRRCNSAKGVLHRMAWSARTGRFPPLMVVRRYLQLGLVVAEGLDLMQSPLGDLPPLPFAPEYIPHRYPRPADLCLWGTPRG